MLSILIPVYNFSVVELVTTLHQQADALENIAFEIVIMDDGSTAEFKSINRSIQQLAHIQYVELTQNVGRSAIRNLLATRAAGDYLLFMDCDSEVIDSHYVATYVSHLHPQKLLYGGRVYHATPPQDKHFYFHWKYGKKREEITARERQRQPYHSFMTNNFLIPKKVFQQIGGFDERLRQYGHEDTVFGLELQRQEVAIIHLDNPLIHIGLEQTEVFLQKTQRGVENLKFLAQHYPALETRLLATFRWVRKLHLQGLISYIFKKIQPRLEEHFQATQPKLFWFDLYKLGLLCSVKAT
ncbi:MAG: glycosyltransferase family 2 protein [Saprospiraceae bacterium]